MKKGFTMIELLAVIVILGILALITVPVLLKTINEARRDSAIESANSYVGQVKKTLLTNSKKLSLKDITCLVDENGDGKTIICNGQALSVKAEGKPPVCGRIIFENYKLKSYIMNISGYRIIRTGPNDKEQIEKIEGCGLEEFVDNNTNLTNTTDNYIGYYADVDSDGNVDGVIYADLAHSKSGKWNDMDDTEYSYEAKDNLKEYIISETNSPVTTFGTNKIIALKPGSNGNSRFYIMALKDFKEGSTSGENYNWYKNTFYYDTTCNCYKGKMNTWETDTSKEFGAGYTNTGNMINIWNKNGVGEGSYDEATQGEYDIWKHVQTKYQEGWYIPSLGEWIAFADYLANKTENPLTTSNYDSTYGLYSCYWSSSQSSSLYIWSIYMNNGRINNDGLDRSINVRLGYTF